MQLFQYKLISNPIIEQIAVLRSTDQTCVATYSVTKDVTKEGSVIINNILI